MIWIWRIALALLLAGGSPCFSGPARADLFERLPDGRIAIRIFDRRVAFAGDARSHGGWRPIALSEDSDTYEVGTVQADPNLTEESLFMAVLAANQALTKRAFLGGGDRSRA